MLSYHILRCLARALCLALPALAVQTTNVLPHTLENKTLPPLAGDSCLPVVCVWRFRVAVVLGLYIWWCRVYVRR